MIDTLHSCALRVRIFMISLSNKSRGGQVQLPNHVIEGPDSFLPLSFGFSAFICLPRLRWWPPWSLHPHTIVSKAGRKEERERRLSTWATVSLIRQDKFAPRGSPLLCFIGSGSRDSYLYQSLRKHTREPMASLARL